MLSKQVASAFPDDLADLRCMVEHINIHSFIREDPYLFATEVREEVDPECIAPPRAKSAYFLHVQVELSQGFQRSR